MMERRNRNDRRAAMESFLGEGFAGRCSHEERVRDEVMPSRVVWKTQTAEAVVQHAEALLHNVRKQVTLENGELCWLRNRGGQAGLLLDFGVELNGGVRLLAYGKSACETFRIRVRFGESAMEAMGELGGVTGATNDHAIRDTVVDVASLGEVEVGNTGFRFVRIDLLEGGDLGLAAVKAIFIHRDVAMQGSFSCSDPLLNRVWLTGAYTVFLNMQRYLWDGIKRDRLVWVGDMHPETSTIQAVFGQDPVVPESLDLIRDITPLPEWMNGFPSYSMWWVLIHHGWFMHNGELAYLNRQKAYLSGLLAQLAGAVTPQGESRLDGPLFLDWPTSSNPEAVAAGVHALHAWCLRAGAAMMDVLEDPSSAQACRDAAGRLQQAVPDPNGSKQAGAMLALSGLGDAKRMNRSLLEVGGSAGMSTFYGYYILQARARAGDIQGCLDSIREYWGGMLSLGATTFWEDFDMAWLQNAAPIDELTPEGRVDVHGSYGNYCYKGYRHSLCHGWASGPTAWLSEHVLGVQPVAPGCVKVRIQPQLGDLAWAEGVYPTPHGPIRVRHEKRPDGSLHTDVQAPEAVTVLTESAIVLAEGEL